MIAMTIKIKIKIKTAGLQSPQRLARERQRELESFGHGGNTQRLLLSEEIKNRETRAVGQHTTGSPQGRMECGRGSHDHTLLSMSKFVQRMNRVIRTRPRARLCCSLSESVGNAFRTHFTKCVRNDERRY